MTSTIPFPSRRWRDSAPMGPHGRRRLSPMGAALQVFERMLTGLIRQGSLTVVLPDGDTLAFGERGAARSVVINIRDGATLRRLARNPDLALGEAYMDGGVTLEQGTIWDLLDLIGANLEGQDERPPGPILKLKNRLAQANGRIAARRNVAHHYDLSFDLYRRFLDQDLQYSCAYFERPDMTLEEAQAAKKRRLAAKLLLEPGQKVLDIGCGWGGLDLTLAEAAPVEVTGVTLSKEQLAIAQRRAQERRLADRVHFELRDYRDVEGPFDRIVSVGMFEHVGTPNYQAYFDSIARLLTDDGVAVVHSIGQKHPSGRPQPWINKYIFPGGYTPALSEVLPAIERAGLWVTDVEILRLHYAETLKAWRERFEAQRDEIAHLYDERFCRMWEFYLSICETGFRHMGSMVFQLQLTKKVDAAPVTRSYMAA